MLGRFCAKAAAVTADCEDRRLIWDQPMPPATCSSASAPPGCAWGWYWGCLKDGELSGNAANSKADKKTGRGLR